MSEVIYIRPLGEVEECKHCGGLVLPEWAVFRDPDEDSIAGPFKTRGEAKQAAFDARDSRSLEAVVLLRADGSVHSEVRAGGGKEQNERTHNLVREGQVVQGGTAKDGDS